MEDQTINTSELTDSELLEQILSELKEDDELIEMIVDQQAEQLIIQRVSNSITLSSLAVLLIILGAYLAKIIFRKF